MIAIKIREAHSCLFDILHNSRGIQNFAAAYANMYENKARYLELSLGV